MPLSNSTIEEISLRAAPFALISVVAIFIIAYVPEISLFLPRLFGYQ